MSSTSDTRNATITSNGTDAFVVRMGDDSFSVQRNLESGSYLVSLQPEDDAALRAFLEGTRVAHSSRFDVYKQFVAYCCASVTCNEGSLPGLVPHSACGHDTRPYHMALLAAFPNDTE